MTNKEIVKVLNEIIEEKVNKAVKEIFRQEYNRMLQERKTMVQKIKLLESTVSKMQKFQRTLPTNGNTEMYYPREMPKKDPIKSTGDPIKDILEETKMEMLGKTSEDGTLKFDTSHIASMMGYGNEENKLPDVLETHHGRINTEAVPESVKNAITRDYSALMKKMDEIKKKKG